MAEKRARKAEEEAKEAKANEALRRKQGKVSVLQAHITSLTRSQGPTQNPGGASGQGGYEGG